jgi:hypothetical protein
VKKIAALQNNLRTRKYDQTFAKSLMQDEVSPKIREAHSMIKVFPRVTNHISKLWSYFQVH